MPNQRHLLYDRGRNSQGGQDLKRREFVATAAAATTSAGCGARLAAGYRFFTKDEARAIDAWTECLIPADDLPGAAQAQAVRYIDLQLTRRFKRLQESYRRAVEAIDRTAQEAHRKLFADLTIDQQTSLLAIIEAGKGDKAVWGQDGGKAAFEMVLSHTMQGFFGNPRHGGNRDFASAKLVGVAPLQSRGRLHYSFKENS